jgi:molybdopterin converting factor small subunit
MVLRIQCFGIASEICAADFVKTEQQGGDFIEAQLPEKSTVGELKIWLREKYPALNELRHFFIARNQQQARLEEIIEAEDELVIIPPVAGG